MPNSVQINQIRDHIAQDELTAALESMRLLLGNNPKLDEALHQSGRFHNIRKQIRLGLVSHSEATLTQNQIRFGLLELLREIELGGVVSLPRELADNIITDRNRWVESLRQEFLRRGIAVSNRPDQIIQYFGWLIEEYLRKMQTNEGQQHTLRAFSYMTEAWQSSLRYLCYIQLSQLLKLGEKSQNAILTEFIAMQATSTTADSATEIGHETEFDYLSLLFVGTDLLREANRFVPEITTFVQELTNAESEIFDTTRFLQNHRRRLLADEIKEDEHLPNLIDEYRTALVYWLRKIAFLARYRLVSIKEISLNYRLGTAQRFVHLYGELHGVYDQAFSDGEDYNFMAIEGVFTYSHSVLLFKGNEIQTCLQNIGDPSTYLSLSPLVIDQSVFSAKNTDTPEIYYYTGCTPGGRQYEYAQYKNELPLSRRPLSSNKTLRVRAENTQQPKLNELYEQLETVFRPFKTSAL